MEGIVVILHRPQDPRNIGAVVRAMLNTGFQRLRLVEPPPFDPDLIAAVAHRPDPVLTRLTIHSDLADATADIRYLVGTSDRPHLNLPWRNDVRQWAVELHRRATVAGPVALLFGPEDNGLSREELSRCHEIIGLPINPAYPTLNLAQAVLLILYELQQVTPPSPPPSPPAEPPADLADYDRLFTVLDELITATQFVKSGNGMALRRRLRAIINRAGLSQRDAAVLTALLRAAVRR
ncbi:RNA methyltransferase [Chloroflexus aggregans]|uniref:tRNA/rRNA methyltransferase (SpoU) n=1 Tax=Chloroflexus aggregans (strain MD-66 / DSM 9485) TaxID=326427 RepID=B8GCX9_CHLAD|nr:RNA methyltransferase [Chloroflexus aggregans]ACL23179.1 tRNA/rRNA methyltransferase (SpoU) [Chloroflexus aggregans DSM 9485]